MKTYIQLFWNLLLLGFTISILWFAWETWTFHSEVEKLSDMQSTSVSTDKKLQRTVDELEESLKERSELEFKTRIDPLELSRVVISKNIMMDEKNFMAAIEKRPRLSCIIAGETPRAIIRLKNKNHIVVAGDVFEGYKVRAISDDLVKLSRSGRTMNLKVQAATKDLAKRISDMNFEF